MDAADEVSVVVVGSDPLGEADMVALSRAATVVGPVQLLETVRHLCTPRTELVVGEDAGQLPRPAVVLRPPERRDTEPDP